MKHRLVVLLSFFLVPAATSAQEAKDDGFKVLERFVGSWKADVVEKPSKSAPQGNKRESQENNSSVLKGRFVLGRELGRPDGGKALWFMTHDPDTNSYPFWFFSSSVPGGEWKGTWSEATKTLASQASDTPEGWTSHGTSRFPDKDTNDVAVWMKDETGALLFDSVARKIRQPATAGQAMLAEWSRTKDDDKLPIELKVLERLAGTWTTTAIARPAEWTPKEQRTTAKVTRKWVLDDRFLQDTSESSDGTQSISLVTYDSRKKAYRSWWFSSEGYRNKSIGHWDAGKQTLSFKIDMGKDPMGKELVAGSSVRFLGKDQHVWRVLVRDGAGKLYFDAEWQVSRSEK